MSNEVMMMGGLFGFIVICVTAAITNIIIPYFKSNFSGDKLDSMLYWMKVAIFVVESVFDEPKQGAKKKEAVMNFMKENFNVEEDDISGAIDYFVEQLKKENIL